MLIPTYQMRSGLITKQASTLQHNLRTPGYPDTLNQLIIHDRGTEFTGNDFQMMLRKYNIRSRQITTKNPQANAICESMHQSMANQIRSVYNNNPPKTSDNARQLIDTLSANVIYMH